MAESLCSVCTIKKHCMKSLATVLIDHSRYSDKVNELSIIRMRLEMLKKRCNELSKQFKDTQNQRHILINSNNKREERLTRVKQRDYKTKLTIAEVECRKKKRRLDNELSELQSVRGCVIRTIADKVFNVPLNDTIVAKPTNNPTTPTNITTTPINTSSITNGLLLDYDMIHPDDHQRPHPICHMASGHVTYIGYGALPNSEQLSEYLSQSDKSIGLLETDATAEQLVGDHLSDSSLLVAAAIASVGHMVLMMSSLLNHTLPHPLPLPVILSEYGSGSRSVSELTHLLAKLDDNIMFLCFTQHVDPTVLMVGDTIGNLRKLISCNKLGRTGSFSCHPELLRYPQLGLKNKPCPLDMALDWDNEPPILHTAQRPVSDTGQTSLGDSFSSDSEGEEGNHDNIATGWEEVHDTIVPSSGFTGHTSSTGIDRLEYGLSYSDYTLLHGLNNESRRGLQREEVGVSSSSGLLDTIGTLLGSGWLKK